MVHIPKISVIMPVYNCELYVAQSIQSILNQTYSNFELIIIDDNSSDQTLSICKNFNDQRILIIEKVKNCGLTDSLNYGLSIAKSEYIARMDGDDISVPTRFENQVRFLETYKDVVVCGCSFKILGTDEEHHLPEMHEDIKTRLLYGNCIAHPSVMFRNRFMQTHNLKYNPDMEPAEDYDLWVRISKIGKLHNLTNILFHYRQHDNQISQQNSDSQIKRSIAVRQKMLDNLNIDFTNEQRALYLKSINGGEQLSFIEFESFITLRNNVLASPQNFFNNDGFINYWKHAERRIIAYMFKYRKEYSIRELFNYIKISNKLMTPLSIIETFKLVGKSIIKYKKK